MAQGFDCSTQLTYSKAKQFADQGFTCVGRYLADPEASKHLSAIEAQAITNAGLYIISFFERYANRASEGVDSGTEDGQLALQYAKEVGQPEGTTIYFAVDYDAQPADYDAIEAYMRAADKEIVGYELGVYGSYAVVEEMLARGVATKLMQTVAWSHDKRSANAQIFQKQIDIVRDGIGIDLDDTNGDAGGWKVGMAIQPIHPISAGDCKQIEAIMSDYWHRMEGNKEVQDFTHYLMNQVRKAAGQPEE